MNSSSEKHSQNSAEAGDNLEEMKGAPVAQVSEVEPLDRGNLGNARLQGLPRDTLHGDPTGVLFDWINSGFFFSYILFQVPATILSKLFPPRLWLGGAAVGWGICSVLMATGFNFGSLMACRLALGVFEAAFGPGTVLYFSFFYTKTEVGLRLASFFGFGAVAGAFGGLIAFGVQHAHSSVAQWRLLFIIEGLPAIIMGCVAFIWLPDRPEMTSFLTEDERKLAVARMNRGISGDSGPTINKSHIVAALTDWRVYVGGVIYFGLNCALTAMSAFLPTILKTLGFTNANAQLLTVPNYAVAAVVLVGTCWISDKQQSRGTYRVTFPTGSLLLFVQNVHVRYFATFCIVSGTYACIGVTIAWYSHNLGSETKRAAGIPIYMGIGQCGSILGSHIFLATEGPKYIKGFAVCCALEGVVAISAVILSVSYRIENKRRDRLYGKPVLNEKVDVSELADQAPTFRYIP
ncbi:major facilitator superfamily domain-containing protein [Hysterangium stoloniferum]|nr:major facilitator superfamily domain-containing protein [Hysterangium stoloniferum]